MKPSPASLEAAGVAVTEEAAAAVAVAVAVVVAAVTAAAAAVATAIDRPESQNNSQGACSQGPPAFPH